MPKDKRHRIDPAVRQRARELRQSQTPAEDKLWYRVRDRRLGGYKFRRQHPIGRLIVDFYCAETGLVIEIDGDTHTEQAEYDTARTEWLEAQGYQVIRFKNQEALRNLEAVVERILAVCEGLKGGG